VVARTEALIAGLGKAEALRRGAAYAESCGAAIAENESNVSHSIRLK
jgi:hypothetical protein